MTISLLVLAQVLKAIFRIGAVVRLTFCEICFHFLHHLLRQHHHSAVHLWKTPQHRNYLHVVSTNFVKTLVCKRENDVILWRHKLRISSNNDHHTPLLNTEFGRGAYNQSVSPGVTRPLQPLKRTIGSTHPCQSPTQTMKGCDVIRRHEHKHPSRNKVSWRPVAGGRQHRAPTIFPKGFHEKLVRMFSWGRQNMYIRLCLTPTISRKFAWE